MSKQIAVRLPDDIVEFIDCLVSRPQSERTAPIPGLGWVYSERAPAALTPPRPG